MPIYCLQKTLQHCSRQWQRALYSQTRTFARKPGEVASHQPIELSYTSIIPEDGNATEKPLVILHGLLGSKRNWGSLCKAFNRDMPDRPVYALDLRNHGSSPHAPLMTYEAMASDVQKFIKDKQLKDVALLGHSMGGKVAMAYALSLKEANVPAGTLSHLIIVDTAPPTDSLSAVAAEFRQYISAMQKIESLPPGVIKTRADADHMLKESVPDISVRQFLLTNLKLPSHSRTAIHHEGAQEKAKFIVPLGFLSQYVDALGSFPYRYNAAANSVPTTWDGPTLVVKGTKSAYINHKNKPALQAFFPNMHLDELDTGHWVHAEKPNEFRKLVVDFLKNS
ncbi:Alpha/Beta hydrolase protein [Flammula alnicola]|nr:Alpha/Beta hydrolase protein [Flammula alnicola]